MLANEHACDGTERIESLRKVQPLGRTFARAKHGDQRIGRGFQEGQATCDDVQCQQEKDIGVLFSGGVEQERAARVEKQPEHNGTLVPEAAHEHGCRDCKSEITEIERALHQAGLEVGKLEDLLELLDEDVIEVVGDTPQEEQADNEDEEMPRRPRVTRVAQCFVVLHLWLRRRA